MDITALAQQAVSVAAEHLSAVAAGVVDAAEDGAVSTVYGLLRERLSRTVLGKTVLKQLRQQPRSPERQQVAAAAVAEQAEADPEFAEALRSSVGAVIDQGNTGQFARHSPVNVTASRDVRLHRTNIAAGDIDNSRRSVRIGLGGWVLVAVLLAGGATTAGVLIGNSEDPSVPAPNGADTGSSRVAGNPGGLPDPASIGTGKGEAGVRQAVEAFRDAFAARDTARLCALASESGNYPLGECPRLVSDAASGLPAEYVAESRSLSVEEVTLGPDTSSGTPFALVSMINRNSAAECRSWTLFLYYYDGRWQIELHEFVDRYLREYGKELGKVYCDPL